MKKVYSNGSGGGPAQLLFFITVNLRGMAFSRDFSINLSPQCRAFSTALKTEKLKAPLFPGSVGAGTTNEWCISARESITPAYVIASLPRLILQRFPTPNQLGLNSTPLFFILRTRLKTMCCWKHHSRSNISALYNKCQHTVWRRCAAPVYYPVAGRLVRATSWWKPLD